MGKNSKEGKKRMNKPLKIVLITLLCIVLTLVLVVGGYFAYLLIAYHRLGDQPVLEVQGEASANAVLLSEIGKEGKEDVVNEYKLVSYNIGFGAYESDYGFFMDGGEQSRAWSEERLDKNMKAISTLLKEQNADFYFVQEVDFDSTRSYHFDERNYLTQALTNKSYTFAQNFDSPYLFYPFLSPHGIAISGIMTFSYAKIERASRYELPIETGLSKLVDLDRCYSKNYVKIDGSGRYLVLYNFHLSAYTSDPSTANNQLKVLLDDMESEFDKGNYCIAGGDFNKDILGDSSVYFGKSDKEYTWAQPIPPEILAGYHATLVKPLDEKNPVPTCRNADGPYTKEQFQLTIDGFLVSPNVSVKSAAVIDTGFAYSDHNPVEMTFVLLG